MNMERTGGLAVAILDVEGSESVLKSSRLHPFCDTLEIGGIESVD